MKDLARLNALRSWVDDLLETARRSASGLEADRIGIDQAFNDQACLLLCWGQLEQASDSACRVSIRRRRADVDWQVRRGWDLYNPDDPQLSGLTFEERSAMVLDGAAGRGQPHALTMRHREARNRIAHGKLEQARTDPAAVIRDFYLIQSALHRAA